MTLQRIDAMWAAFFGLSAPAFLQSGIQVVAHHRLADYQGVWLFRHHASLCLSVPPDRVADLRMKLRAHTVDSLYTEPGIRLLLGPRVERITGPAYQGYVEREQFRPASHPEVRSLSKADRAALRELAIACGDEAWENAGIVFNEPHVFGRFVDDRLVAAARYQPGWEETAHIGVATHPAYRRRGHGRAVVSAATARGLEAGFIVLYQTLLANSASVALATSLGYQRYATHLAVQLTPEAAHR